MISGVLREARSWGCILDTVRGDRFVSEAALSSRIAFARRTVGDDGKQQRVIQTVHGRGFKFVAELR
jgi:DNA-binding winged helix-turn-helix (wHTH) protein